MISKNLKNNYKILIFKDSKKFLDELIKINPYLREQLCEKIREIQSDPFKSKFKKLKNSQGYRRARSGDYRIIYFIEDNKIFVIKIGLRKSVYKKKFTIKN